MDLKLVHAACRPNVLKMSRLGYFQDIQDIFDLKSSGLEVRIAKRLDGQISR